MFDIKRESAPTNGTVIPALSGFHLLAFSYRDDKKMSRENITAAIISRPVIGFVIQDGAARPITFPTMQSGEINATMIPSGAIVEGDVVFDNLEAFLMSLLERGMQMRRPVQPPAEIAVRLRGN